jgi:hypothetical protein
VGGLLSFRTVLDFDFSAVSAVLDAPDDIPIMRLLQPPTSLPPPLSYDAIRDEAEGAAAAAAEAALLDSDEELEAQADLNSKEILKAQQEEAGRGTSGVYAGDDSKGPSQIPVTHALNASDEEAENGGHSGELGSRPAPSLDLDHPTLHPTKQEVGAWGKRKRKRRHIRACRACFADVRTSLAQTLAAFLLIFTELQGLIALPSPADMVCANPSPCAQSFDLLYLPICPQVWVLFGGDGSMQGRGLRGALHALSALQGHPELKLEAFMLEPTDAGLL